MKIRFYLTVLGSPSLEASLQRLEGAESCEPQRWKDEDAAASEEFSKIRIYKMFGLKNRGMETMFVHRKVYKLTLLSIL